MKKLLIATSLFLSMTLAHADDGWETDFEAALARAKSQDKHVLINFTGSDWCYWCIKLKEEVFSKNTFTEFAETELVLVEIDFPSKKEQSEALIAQNEKLGEKYNIGGYPTVLILSPDGELIAKTGYREGGPTTYMAHIQKIIGE